MNRSFPVSTQGKEVEGQLRDKAERMAVRNRERHTFHRTSDLGVTGPEATWFSSDLIWLIAWPVWGIAGVHGDLRSCGNRVLLRAGAVAAEGVSAA
jgi:hypothetical protein